MMRCLLLLAAASAALASAHVRAAQFGPPSNLRVEGLLQDVAVISEPHPLLQFVPPAMPAVARGVVQTAARIVVSSAATGEVVWDSGEVSASPWAVGSGLLVGSGAKAACASTPEA